MKYLKVLFRISSDTKFERKMGLVFSLNRNLVQSLGKVATATATSTVTKTSVEGKSASSEGELLLFFLVMLGFFAAMLYLARQEMGRTMRGN